jgi:hypothetical protein
MLARFYILITFDSSAHCYLRRCECSHHPISDVQGLRPSSPQAGPSGARTTGLRWPRAWPQVSVSASTCVQRCPLKCVADYVEACKMVLFALFPGGNGFQLWRKLSFRWPLVNVGFNFTYVSFFYSYLRRWLQR